MEPIDLETLSAKELRALLRQETRKFLALLDQDTVIQDLEIVREKIRRIWVMLKIKEENP